MSLPISQGHTLSQRLVSSTINAHPSRPNLMVFCLALADALSLVASVGIAVFLKWIFGGTVDLNAYLKLWPFVIVFLVVYGAVGLYSEISLGPPEEVRRSTLSSATVFFCLALLTISYRDSSSVFTITELIAVVCSLILVPLVRTCLRLKLSSKSWWGLPAVIFGDQETAARAAKAMLDSPSFGLKPTTIVDLSGSGVPALHGIPVISESELPAWAARSSTPSYAVIALPGAPQEQLTEIMDSYGSLFTRTLVIPHLWEFSCLWVSPKNIGGMLGLEVAQHIHMPSKQFVKRAVDLALTLSVSIFFFPLICLLALFIRLDSAGPVFYGQRRIGRGGREFRAWKFRSMIPDAENVLQDYLVKHPELREEWERDHKLRFDPRVTRVGRILRKTSLDELPQLWNILRGDMSLVGPRPIVRAEIERYGRSFEVYARVRGGLTGLWQVSGRSDTSYQQRINFDTFYVRNWSVWLDLCILFRTVGVVLFRSGAY